MDYKVLPGVTSHGMLALSHYKLFNLNTGQAGARNLTYTYRAEEGFNTR